MAKERPNRVAEAIKAELMDLLRTEMKDPRIGFVSIVKVDVTGDLRHAKVYFSVLGDAQAKEATRAGLQSAAGFLRNHLGARLRLRYTPELSFHLDDSIEHGARIAALLNRLPETGSRGKPGEE